MNPDFLFSEKIRPFSAAARYWPAGATRTKNNKICLNRIHFSGMLNQQFVFCRKIHPPLPGMKSHLVLFPLIQNAVQNLYRFYVLLWENSATAAYISFNAQAVYP